MLLDIVYLIAGFVILTYGANKLVDGGTALAHRLKVSAIVIGLTVVAFGTSTPEFVVNIVSSVDGNSELALGNVLGSNIFNILGIIGITALIYPLSVKRNTTWIEIPLVVFAAILLLIMVNSDSQNMISRAEGIILLCFFTIFLAYTLVLAKKGNAGSGQGIHIKPYKSGMAVFFIIIGLICLASGGRLLVTGAVNIAHMIGISDRIIALTIVSIGTSLPELATSVIATRKKNTEIAIGNVVGSNIFNTFLVLGASATVSPVKVATGSILDLTVNLIAATLLFIFIFTGQGRNINRVEGIFFIAIYIAYLIMLLHK